jgi:hypothetical protein
VPEELATRLSEFTNELQVVPALDPRLRVDIPSRRREHPLPAGLPWRTRVFSLERVRERDRSAAVGQIPFVSSAHQLKVFA